MRPSRRPASTGLGTNPGHPTKSAALRSVRSWILAGTRCYLQRHREGEGSYRRDSEGAETDPARLSGSALEVTSSRRPKRGFTPASTSSSQLCCRRCRKRRRGNRLTSPPDCARAPQPDRSEERDL